MKKWVLIFGLVLSFNAMAETKTYECGEHCIATLDDNGVMRISGEGKMIGYNSETRYQTPWSKDSARITSVIVEDGITNVGYNAFFECSHINTIELAKTVKTVDVCAFDEISTIKSVTMYDSTVWKDQCDFNIFENSPKIQINCYGDLDKCQTNFLNTPKMKTETNFHYKGKKIYTIDEANKITGPINRVSIRYR